MSEKANNLVSSHANIVPEHGSLVSKPSVRPFSGAWTFTVDEPDRSLTYQTKNRFNSARLTNRIESDFSLVN